MQRLSAISIAMLLLFVFSMVPSPASAAKKSYVVYMGSHGHIPMTTSHAHRPVITEEDQIRATDKHHLFLASFLGSYDAAKEAMIHSYNKYINGFSAVLEEADAAKIAAHPDVISVFLNKPRKLHTTHSWDFLQPKMADATGHLHYGPLWRKAKFGEDIIIANLDTGVWPESKSFSDEGYGPIPAKWTGICQSDTELPVTCNKKLIGARYFNRGYLNLKYAKKKKVKVTDVWTPRDMTGHGTHTLSTAGGNFVPNANVFGIGNGTAKGGAPRARVAAYKVCWTAIDGAVCIDDDIIQGFEHAIHDGVDVVSMSLGGSSGDFATNGMAIGAFHAVKHGVAVVASAGNSGPMPGTVSNVAPWMFTVAASTVDREFQTFAKLGNSLRLKGSSLSPPLAEQKMYPLISAAVAKAVNAPLREALLCKAGTLDSKKVNGKIVVCRRRSRDGDTNIMDKGQEVLLAGGVGMILCNGKAYGSSIQSHPHLLPAVHLSYSDGQAVFKYLNSTKSPIGHITPPTAVVGIKPAPSMATFSSRGPNSVAPTILKPDITAPGVDIIAAYTEAVSPTKLSFDTRRTPFSSMSGTSMACPHVAGVVALLRAVHPDWSQAALMSSLMTTAKVRDNTGNSIRDESLIEATPFNYGSGHIIPNRAMDPGLVYDAGITDYLNFLCALGLNSTQMTSINEVPYNCPESASLDINYPSISVPNMSGSITVTRKLKNVGTPGVYGVRWVSPRGIFVMVHPRVLKFHTIGEEKSFKVTLSAEKYNNYGNRHYVFGKMIWSDGKHKVSSPIAVQY